MDFEQARFNMIEQQVRPWMVLDPEVLQLLSLVRREDFVPTALRNLAFTDTELPLGPPGRTTMPPRVEARLLQAALARPTDRVLVVGIGSGYLTALLAHQAGEVVSVDSDADLVAHAQAALHRLGLTRCEVTQGDPVAGRPGSAPFDLVVLNGSVPEVPKALLDQTKPGGRLVGVVGEDPVMRAVRVSKAADGSLRTEALFDTLVGRLPGVAESSPFVF